MSLGKAIITTLLRRPAIFQSVPEAAFTLALSPSPEGDSLE
jgi:hypothetical protein